jgi:DUF4097 and DUF4098 domain-containing protein YvlB
MKLLLIAAAAGSVFFLGSPDHHRTIEEHYNTTPSQSIEMRGFSGSRIRFRCWDKNEVSVRLDISYSSSDERDEQRYLDGISLKQTQTSDGLRIEYQEQAMSRRSDRTFWTWLRSAFSGSFTSKEIEGEIFVPRSNPLKAEVRYGSIEMDGMKGDLQLLGTSNTVVLKDCSAIGEVNNDYGRVTIENGGGSLRLSSKSTTIVIDRFAGKAEIDANYSNITARNVTQSMTIHSTSGTIRVDHVGGDLSIRSDYSNITANDIAGILEVQDKSGRIRAKTMAGVRIDGNYSTIEITDVSGKSGKDIELSGQSGAIYLVNAVGSVQIDNPFGTVNLKEIKGNVEVKSKSSTVTATRVAGDWTSITQYCTLSLRDLNSKRVTISNSSGPIDVRLKVVPSFVDIKNEWSKVSLEMPTGFSGDVDLSATYGHIETNLPLSKNKSLGGSGYAMGKIGSGTGSLTVETKSGTISVIQR